MNWEVNDSIDEFMDDAIMALFGAPRAKSIPNARSSLRWACWSGYNNSVQALHEDLSGRCR